MNYGNVINITALRVIEILERDIFIVVALLLQCMVMNVRWVVRTGTGEGWAEPGNVFRGIEGKQGNKSGRLGRGKCLAPKRA